MNNFIPFSLPEIGDDEITEVVDSLRSGWITTGPKAQMFEEMFSEFLGDSNLYCVSVNSATSGLHLALEALCIGPGDEVIVPTHTFTATAEVVRYLGATPVFVDVNPHSFNMSVDSFKAGITSRTKAVMPVHFAGLSCEMEEIIAVARSHHIHIVEDAAHALPTTCNKKFIGTLNSDSTVFSFYANKTMTTGEGGMLVTRNKEIADRAKQMRLHGISRDAFDRFTSKKPSWHYEVIAPGFKYNLTDIAASLGIHQLKKVEQFQNRRQEIAIFYNEHLKDLPLTLPPMPLNEDVHAWHLYVIQLNKELPLSRDRFIELMYENGIGCGVHYIPLHLHPYWRDTYKLTPEMFPVSQRIYEQSVSLPIYSKMTDEDMERVVSTVAKILNNA
ncbi:DegT/DnrJ/EryC1/StrS family aminotransferase [Alphaproteobacteria bacterium LSUCC0684]